jgi:hypothetical protein
MRATTKLAIVTAVTAVIGVVSCDGGTGALAYSADGWDSDHGNLSQRERPLGAQDPPSNSEQPTDRLPDTKDDPPVTGGGTGGGTFVCAGIFECVLTGSTRTCTTTNDGESNCTQGQTLTFRVRIALNEVNGQCMAGEAVLEPNGTFRGEDDDDVGTWTRQGNGFFIQVGESSGLCVPSSGPVGLVGADGQTVSGSGSSSTSSSSTSSSSTSSSSSSGQGDISIDPGTGQDGSSTSSSGG